MKLKSLFALAAATIAAAAFVTSCDDADNDFHQFYWQGTHNNNALIVYADQTEDSINVTSTDTWTYTCESNWMQMSVNGKPAPDTLVVRKGYIDRSRATFTFTPNTTGQERTATFTLTNPTKHIGSFSPMFTQKPYLNISLPVYDSTTGTFTLKNINSEGLYSATTKDGVTLTAKPVITFTVYADGAELTGFDDCDWLTHTLSPADIRKNVLCTDTLKVSRNTTGHQRSVTLTLKSNGVSTPITVVQD